MPMTNQEKVLAARELISDRKRWCVDILAEDRDGDACEPTAPSAVAWCAIGALRRAFNVVGSDDPTFEWLLVVGDELVRDVSSGEFKSLSMMNDDRSSYYPNTDSQHRDVLRVLTILADRC